jgi:putative ABC transport system permease protein
MFFLTYLRRELGRRKRQTVLIALGFALGVGLVITVTGVSSGVTAAQAKVLHALYGVGTDLTVTEHNPPFSGIHPLPGIQCATSSKPGTSSKPATVSVTRLNLPLGQSCSASLGYPPLGTETTKTVATVAKLHDVAGAAGGLTLDYIANLGTPFTGISGSNPMILVDGVDVHHLGLGTLSSGTLTSGREFSASQAHSDVAVVDSNYATAKNLHVGSTLTIIGQKFRVIGLVRQSQAASPPDVYIPLARAQALYVSANPGFHLAGDLVNTIYVSTSSAANVASVQSEIQKAVPAASVSSQAHLPSDFTGSLKSTAKLAHDLGRWLAVLVLLAAFAVAILLTLAAVARRVRELGTLKALGWRSRRIIAQVLGESLVVGVVGGVLGIGIGYGAAGVITALAPSVSEIKPAPMPSSPNVHVIYNGPYGHPTPSTVPVHLSAPVPAEIIVVALVIAIAGGLLAGLFASWRIARLRPADALARVA